MTDMIASPTPMLEEESSFQPHQVRLSEPAESSFKDVLVNDYWTNSLGMRAEPTIPAVIYRPGIAEAKIITGETLCSNAEEFRVALQGSWSMFSKPAALMWWEQADFSARHLSLSHARLELCTHILSIRPRDLDSIQSTLQLALSDPNFDAARAKVFGLLSKYTPFFVSEIRSGAFIDFPRAMFEIAQRNHECEGLPTRMSPQMAHPGHPFEIDHVFASRIYAMARNHSLASSNNFHSDATGTLLFLTDKAVPIGVTYKRIDSLFPGLAWTGIPPPAPQTVGVLQHTPVSIPLRSFVDWFLSEGRFALEVQTGRRIGNANLPFLRSSATMLPFATEPVCYDSHANVFFVGDIVPSVAKSKNVVHKADRRSMQLIQASHSEYEVHQRGMAASFDIEETPSLRVRLAVSDFPGCLSGSREGHRVKLVKPAWFRRLFFMPDKRLSVAKTKQDSTATDEQQASHAPTAPTTDSVYTSSSSSHVTNLASVSPSERWSFYVAGAHLSEYQLCNVPRKLDVMMNEPAKPEWYVLRNEQGMYLYLDGRTLKCSKDPDRAAWFSLRFRTQILATTESF